jgi:hypothetical protein
MDPLVRYAMHPRIHAVLGGLLTLVTGVAPAWSAPVPASPTAHPLAGGPPLVFVTRHQYRADHHNTETMFQTGEINTGKYQPGGALKVIDFARGGAVRTLVDPGPEGVVRDPDVSFDGTRVLFSMRKNVRDDYHLYEVNVTDGAVRQLTRAAGVFDIDPLYLPGGDIVFTSSREPKYCACNRHIMGNLFRMRGDGANIHQIGKSTLHEGHATLLNDGRLLYDRWEYVDRNFGDAQALWVVNPDGTQHEIYWGANLSSPGGVIDARAVPGSPLAIAVWGACHDRPWGALALLDRRKGMNTRASVVRTWPADAVNLLREDGVGHWDSTAGMKIKYEDPYPLDAERFLVARMIEAGRERTGLYLVDVQGNETLLYEEPTLGCYDPVPLAPRTPPPVIPSRRDFAGGPGTFYVQDVYVGTHMAGVERGTVKWLRVVESPEKRGWSARDWGGQGAQAPAMNWHNFENKRVLGTVPVEADGSAYFEVPSDRFVFFQLLDADGMMVQSMRSGTQIQSGERQSCIGCHESRNGGAPPTGAGALALKRPPSQPQGGSPREFSFTADVQPILDRHCVRCHDFAHPQNGSLVLAGDRDLIFSTAYQELWAKKMVTCAGGGPAAVLPAKSWGAHASKLIQVLRQGHEKVTLAPEELAVLTTWVDLNAPYYPSYYCAFPDHQGGRSPLNPAEVKRLSDLTGVNLAGQANHGALRQPWISFDRPEVSPALARIPAGQTAMREEALALIRVGAQRLQESPEADRPGFVPCAADREREAKYVRRQQAERRSRAALREGTMIYDE